jgi:hypothetical protein
MRCYFIRDGHFSAVEVLAATSDADAIKQAEALYQQRTGHITGFELWDEARFVYRHPDGGAIADVPDPLLISTHSICGSS